MYGVSNMSDNTLKTFTAPNSDQIITFETDEVTSLCPFEFGGPDYYTVTIMYELNDKCIESKSLKKYFESLRNRELTAEQLADDVYTVVSDAIGHEQCYISVEQSIRGGITETVEVGNVEISN